MGAGVQTALEGANKKNAIVQIGNRLFCMCLFLSHIYFVRRLFLSACLSKLTVLWMPLLTTALSVQTPEQVHHETGIQLLESRNLKFSSLDDLLHAGFLFHHSQSTMSMNVCLKHTCTHTHSAGVFIYSWRWMKRPLTFAVFSCSRAGTPVMTSLSIRLQKWVICWCSSTC